MPTLFPSKLSTINYRLSTLAAACRTVHFSYCSAQIQASPAPVLPNDPYLSAGCRTWHARCSEEGWPFPNGSEPAAAGLKYRTFMSPSDFGRLTKPAVANCRAESQENARRYPTKNAHPGLAPPALSSWLEKRGFPRNPSKKCRTNSILSN